MVRWEVEGPPQLSWEKLQSNKRRELERLSDLYMDNLKKADVEFIEGRARIVDPNTVEVNGKQYRVRFKFQNAKFIWLLPSTTCFAKHHLLLRSCRHLTH